MLEWETSNTYDMAKALKMNTINGRNIMEMYLAPYKLNIEWEKMEAPEICQYISNH